MRAFLLAAVAVATAAPAPASAEPIFTLPEVGRAKWGGRPDDLAAFALVVDVRAAGVLGADRLASWPDRRLGLEPRTPQLIAARPGLRVDFLKLPVTLLARVDFAETARPAVDERALPLIDVFVDDLYAEWRPSEVLQVVAGRSRVAFTRLRHLEEVRLPLGATPFVVDRVAPDRRWGAAAGLDLGDLALHGGVYADADALEPRLRADDPSRGGLLAFVAAGQWRPVGLGALARVREDGSVRVDGSLSLELDLGWLSALVEGLAAADGGEGELGGHATVRAVYRRVTLALRGELDGGAAGGGAWATAAEIGWDVTRDGLNRISVAGWLRRDRDRGTPYDAIVVFLQARL